MSRKGLWTAEVEVDGEESSKLRGVVSIELGGAFFKATAIRPPRAFQGRTSAILVAGTNGWAKEVGAQAYAGCPLSLPLGDLAATVGESVSTTSDTTLLAKHLAKWTRVSGPAGRALQDLANEAGAVWRALPDGSIWVGTETWPEANVTDNELLTELAGESGALYASPYPTLLPGTVLGGRRISHVLHTWNASGLRTRVLFETDTASAPRGALAALERIIRKFLAPTVYLGRYPARVVDQDGSGRLDVKPDDTRIPQMKQVPLRFPIPGMSLEVQSGARVLLSFENGDPKKPFAELWESGTPTLISIPVGENPVTGEVKLGAGAARVVREGDVVTVGTQTSALVVVTPFGAVPTKLKA